MKPVAGRLFLLSIAVLVSLVFFLPSTPLFSAMPEWWKQYLPNKGITLGLDLQGGIHLVLEVEADRAVEIKLDRDMAAMTELFAEKKLPVESVKRTSPTEITVTLSTPEAKEAVLNLTDDQFPTLSGRSSGDRTLVFSLRPDEAERIKKAAVSQALETVRNRVDQFGVAEPLIQQQGLRQIVVQLPGVKDPGRAKALIKNTALLEFKMLDEDHKVARELPSRVPAGKEEEVLREFGPKIPDDDDLQFGVAEPLIQQQGLRQIVVQLPGVKDPGRAKALIKNTALLEFKMLDEDHKVARELPSRVPAGKEEEVLREFGPKIPDDDEILFE